MKKEISIPLTKVEDFVAANLRRDEYALKRDMQNTKFNDAITARLLAEEKNKAKCDKCGKEFTVQKTAKSPISSPDCK
jgi:late competence protein required for DNA uptake (superfamily II DNA/RNA helicase)